MYLYMYIFIYTVISLFIICLGFPPFEPLFYLPSSAS